ncbi:hypothetical protein CLAFUW4_11206 [Fulvia fulva]|nr:hypothetical protein CLAFUR4_11211 [Fulvia fulva]KAK4620426.1 hypothetical protein CLAFUR0_11216 [Fulvia fulva]WPV17629.1 hypothetical protein CLAFUW4_11206 [Fulvia fulva]WPV31855.1 hypothetical protein CLAFUW7_11202 [Fulvia fulva]
MSPQTQQDLLTLYDVPTKRTDVSSWSPNVWKTRMVLNYKNISYKTVSEPPPIVPKPNGPPQSPYTVPAVRFPDGTYVMDSANIVVELERWYPERSLRLAEGTQDEVSKLFGGAVMPLLPMIYGHIAASILLDESVVECKAKKEKAAGAPFEEWVKANRAVYLGSRVSYGDFAVAGLLEACKRFSEQGLFVRMMGFDQNGVLKGLHGACVKEGWFGKDD